jgi:hypothetical protein
LKKRRESDALAHLEEDKAVRHGEEQVADGEQAEPLPEQRAAILMDKTADPVRPCCHEERDEGEEEIRYRIDAMEPERTSHISSVSGEALLRFVEQNSRRDVLK